jgi:hypothetical protein
LTLAAVREGSGFFLRAALSEACDDCPPGFQRSDRASEFWLGQATLAKILVYPDFVIS